MKMKMYCYLQEGINPVTELIEVPLLDNKQVVEYLRKHKPTKEVKENSFGIIVGGGSNDIRPGGAMRELLDRIAKLEEQVTELSKGKE